MNSFSCLWFFEGYGDHRDIHVRSHSFPTRRSSDVKTCPELDGQKEFPIDARLGRAIAQGEGGGDVEDGKTGDHGEGPGQRRTHMMAEKTGEGHPRRRSLCHGLCKCGRLREFQAHPEAEADEYGAGKEGKAPTPIDELRFAQKCAEQQKQTIGRSEEHTSELQYIMRT